MNFGKTDVLIVVAMSIAIMTMSYTFPAAGLTDESDEVNQSDVPEFDMDANRFDFAGDFPDDPGGPSKITLVRQDDDPDEQQVSRWLHGDTTDGVEATLFIDNGTTDPEPRVTFTNWTSGGSESDDMSFTSDVGNEQTFTNYSYEIQGEYIERENNGQANVTVTVEMLITERPSDKAFLASVPIVGDLFSAGEALAQIIGWIGSIIYWFFGTLFEVSLNLVGILFDVMTYGIDTASWLVDTYDSILSAADSWAAAFIMAPAIILFYEFVKIGMVGISLLPTT